MTTIQGSSQVAAPPPTATDSGDMGNNEIAFDPAFQSTYTFDPTDPATVFKDAYGTPGTDLSTQTYLMLDGMVNNPYNTTDAELFFLFTSNLVTTGAINYSYNVGTAEDPEWISLDDIISGITVTDPTTGATEPLMACLVDVVIQEKYAAEVANGNTDWDPTVSYNGEPSFCDSLRTMFPGDSKVSQQVNAEIDTYDDPETGSTGKWDSYTEENAQQPGETDEEYAARLRADTSQQWADDVNNSNMVEQESVMREAMVHDTGVSGGLMASLMLLYMLLEAMGYSDLYTLTGQVNWYQECTDDLTEMSSEWQHGFDTPDEAYEFVGDVEDFVDEVNSSPQFADSSLVTTVNSSLGEEGFLGMETDYYYKDTNGNWQQATVGDLYNHGDTPVDNGNGQIFYLKLDDGNYTYGVDMDDPAYIDGHGAGTTYNGQVYDSNGQPVTYGWCYENQDEPVYDNTGKQITTSDGSPATGGDVLEHHWPDNGVTDGDFLYYTFNTWSLDPSGTTPPAPQYGLVQGDFNEADTGFTNAAGTSTTLENQTSNWIQEVESAMSKAISTYIDGVNTLIDNQTVS